MPLLLGALTPAAPDRVISDVGMMTVFNVQGTHENGSGVSSLFFLAGGFGAADGDDGPSVTPAPSNMTVVPSEVWENLTTISVRSRRLLRDSGGAGRYRGGLGQEVTFRNDSNHLLTVSFFGQRTEFPAKGLLGGRDGRLRRYLVNGQPVHPKGRHVLQPGDTFTTEEAGAGGYGDPSLRPPEAVLADVRAGLVSVEAALADYGVRIDLADGRAVRT